MKFFINYPKLWIKFPIIRANIMWDFQSVQNGKYTANFNGIFFELLFEKQLKNKYQIYENQKLIFELSDLPKSWKFPHFFIFNNKGKGTLNLSNPANIPSELSDPHPKSFSLSEILKNRLDDKPFLTLAGPIVLETLYRLGFWQVNMLERYYFHSRDKIYIFSYGEIQYEGLWLEFIVELKESSHENSSN